MLFHRIVLYAEKIIRFVPLPGLGLSKIKQQKKQHHKNNTNTPQMSAKIVFIYGKPVYTRR